MPRIPSISCFALLAWAGAAAPAQAGTFVMDSVNPVIVESNDGFIAVEVRGSASYVGPVDPGDQGGQLNTLLNHNKDGDRLDNWSAPDKEGGGNTFTSISPGMVVTCNEQPCTAYGNLYRAACPTTYNYKARGAVTIYHQLNPEIDTMDSGVYLVGCYQSGGGGGGGGGGSDPCGSSFSTVGTISSVESGEVLASDTGGYPLERQDIQGQTRFVLEEWAVISAGRPGKGNAPEVEVIDASSPPYGQTAAAKLRGSGAPTTAGTVLVVDGVDHPRNGRYIPVPEVSLRAEPLPADTQGHDLLVRADFSETGELTDLRVLHSDGDVSDELLAALRQNLEISYLDSGRHRAIAFVTFDLDGAVTVRSSQVVLPQCCCYTDETGVWCL